MNKIKMKKVKYLTVNEAFEKYVISKRALGVKDITVQTYHYHFRVMSKYLDVEKPFSEVTQEDLEWMVVQMRDSELAPNSVSSYLRVFVAFLNWCKKQRKYLICPKA